MRSVSNTSYSSTTTSKTKTKTSKITGVLSASSKTSTSKSGKTGTLTNSQMVKNYTAIKNAASGLQTHVSKLQATGDESLFKSKDELSKNDAKLLKEINSFVEDYNTLVNKMSATGGTLNNLFLKQIKSYATQNQSAFKKIGMKQTSSGTLSVNQKTLQAADTAALQKVFGTKDSFAAKVSAKSKTVESSAKTTLTSLENIHTNSYNKYGRLSGNSKSIGNLLNSNG